LPAASSLVIAPPEEALMFVSISRLLAAVLFAIGGVSSASAADSLKVVASFSILGDLVSEIGGDHVTVRTIVGPNGDAHVYEPTPADARDTAGADLVVVNGLGFEGWLDRLIEASGYSGTVAVASKGVRPLKLSEEAANGMPVEEEDHADAGRDEAGHHHGDIDPHAWQSVPNAEIYVKNIADALCAADPNDCSDYRTNATAYTAELKDIDAAVRSIVAAIPEGKRKVISTHDAFGYFAREYGIAFLAPEGVSTESEASAGDVAALIAQIRAEKVTAVFFENISDPRLIEQIARETGVEPGGELFSDALSPPDGPAPTYAAMMRHNVERLAGAMRGS
jgi:zinc/manganese transport system substrate-binding protein